MTWQDKKEPKIKYHFHTGKIIKKIKILGYQYLSRGEIGKLESEIIDGKRFYYVKHDLGRSKFSQKKNNFKKAEYWEEDIDWNTNWVEKRKPKDKIIFNTKIETPRDTLMRSTGMKLGKEDIHFFNVDKSNVIRDLQLKEGDKLKVTIEVQKR
ncbi:hypothetical protein LCGC14_2051920 [marine sediment metagenome]|uniref:Uncharacterized protein n=1 Tax=marine sediment metagenome TaxID=412755 RepID=A0A0F9ENU9_9ZZZZ